MAQSSKWDFIIFSRDGRLPSKIHVLPSIMYHCPPEEASDVLVNQLAENTPKPLPSTVLQTPPLRPISSGEHDVTPAPGVGERHAEPVLDHTRTAVDPRPRFPANPRLTARCGHAIISQGCVSLRVQAFKKWGRFLHAHPHLSSHWRGAVR